MAGKKNKKAVGKKKRKAVKIKSDNPNHLEDFNWLLEQAVKKPDIERK